MNSFAKDVLIIKPDNHCSRNGCDCSTTKIRTIIAGMYKTNSRDNVDIDKCLIQDPIADRIMKTIKSIMKKYKMKPYNEDTGQGFLRHVLI